MWLAFHWQSFIVNIDIIQMKKKMKNRRLHNSIHHTDMTKRLTRQTKLQYTSDFLKNNQLIVASIGFS